MKVMVTGSNGFIGKNLTSRLSEFIDIELLLYDRNSSIKLLPKLVENADLIFHLAGANRPIAVDEFYSSNSEFTNCLCNSIIESNSKAEIVFTSSTQSDLENDYGISKRLAENALTRLGKINGNTVHILNLPNIYGKWCKPDYNSVVATFCHNISREIPINIEDPDRILELIYIDDLINFLIEIIDQSRSGHSKREYMRLPDPDRINIGDLAKRIRGFYETRQKLLFVF